MTKRKKRPKNNLKEKKRMKKQLERENNDVARGE